MRSGARLLVPGVAWLSHVNGHLIFFERKPTAGSIQGHQILVDPNRNCVDGNLGVGGDSVPDEGS